MKKLATLIVFFFFNGFAQKLSDKEMTALDAFSINIENLDLSNFTVQKDLNSILKLDKKRKTNKTIAIVLTSMAASSMIFGSTLLNKKNTTSDVFGGLMVAGGVIYGGVSIPFWFASKKRKKERDRIIKMLNK